MRASHGLERTEDPGVRAKTAERPQVFTEEAGPWGRALNGAGPVVGGVCGEWACAQGSWAYPRSPPPAAGLQVVRRPSRSSSMGG